MTAVDEMSRMVCLSPGSPPSPLNRRMPQDMDLIEVLWKQDVDLGFSLELFNAGKQDGRQKEVEGEELEKLKALEEIKNGSSGSSPRIDDDDTSSSSVDDDPWAGLQYTIDLETGEYVLKSGAGLGAGGSGVGDDDELTARISDTEVDVDVDDDAPPVLLGLPEFSLVDALQLVGLDEPTDHELELKQELAEIKSEVDDEDSIALGDSADEPEIGLLDEMIQTAQFHHPHARSFQGRMPYARTMSMEQRWQDLANLLSLPGPPGDPFAHHHHHHHHHLHGGGGGGGGGGSSVAGYGGYGSDHRGVLLHNATLAPPVGELNATSPYTMSSAVATSMNLTNSSEPMGDASGHAGFKMDGPHDMMYYQNSTPEMNQTTEGFLSSILNDEDLQLMDMAMNEGMYTMRMLDGANASSNGSVAPAEERMDASSDSAVSSMGSERVSSLSDGEWMETGSDSGHMPGAAAAAAAAAAADSYAMDYHAGKYRPYDYSYSGRKHSSGPVGQSDSSQRMPPMAQKKHQMFGKRYFQSSDGTPLGSHGVAASLPPAPVKFEFAEAAAVAPGLAFGSPVEGAVGPKPPEMKYSCSMDFIRHHPDPRPAMEQVQHNHSYHLPPESSTSVHRPFARDKQKSRRTTEEEHLNRDEKRARLMNIPMSVNDIINLPMDEFNERLSKYDLSEAQLSLIRDIRRRGKNKVAAQNCRKRKLDQILTLADEVKDMRDRKTRIVREREFMLAERQRVKDKFSQLYRHVFQALRDHEGNPYSSYEYSLQQSADGTVLLVPRGNTSSLMDPDLRHKHKDHDARKE